MDQLRQHSGISDKAEADRDVKTAKNIFLMSDLLRQCVAKKNIVEV